MKLNNYCLSSFQDYKTCTPGTYQMTLNGRIFPSNRNTRPYLRDIPAGVIPVIHYDFTYIISRYAYFSPAVKRAILNEVHTLLDFCDQHHFPGIVMHTDYPLAKDCIKKPEKIADHYKASIWDSAHIWSTFVTEPEMLSHSLLQFYSDYTTHFFFPLHTRVLLENTTSVGPNQEGTITWLLNFLRAHPETKSLYSVAWDTEHDYAVTGHFLSPTELASLPPFSIVHLNAVPSEVKPCSGLDRHSCTTLFECSVNDISFYEDLVEALHSYNIPFIREVKSEAQARETEQLSSYTNIEK